MSVPNEHFWKLKQSVIKTVQFFSYLGKTKRRVAVLFPLIQGKVQKLGHIPTEYRRQLCRNKVSMMD